MKHAACSLKWKLCDSTLFLHSNVIFLESQEESICRYMYQLVHTDSSKMEEDVYLKAAI
jgi:hypothetical protein